MTRLWAALAAALLVLCTATPADAHTTLKEASPGAGKTVSSPDRIVLTYDQPVMLPQVVLTDSAGGRHEAGRPQAVDNKVTQQVGGPLPPGVYQVGWRVVSVDGHPVTGEYRFTVRGTSATQESPGAATSPPPQSGVTPGGVTPAGPGASEPAAGSSGSCWWFIALGIALAALIAGAIALLRRRRSG